MEKNKFNEIILKYFKEIKYRYRMKEYIRRRRT